MKLTGSEKQITWAEDIISERKEMANRLEEAIKILSDMSQHEEVVKDPVFGDSTKTCYTHETGVEHDMAFSTMRSWWPDGGPQKDLPAGAREARLWGKSLDDEAAGIPHAARKRRIEIYTATLENFRQALATETDARYWIDQR